MLGNFAGKISSRVLQGAQPSMLAKEVAHASHASSVPSWSMPVLLTIEDEVIDRTQHVSLEGPFAFVHNPFANMEPGPSLIDLPTHINTGPYALDPRNPSNLRFLENESRLAELLTQVNSLDAFGHDKDHIARDRLANRIHREMDRVRTVKVQEWFRQADAARAIREGHIFVDTGEFPLSALDPSLTFLSPIPRLQILSPPSCCCVCHVAHDESLVPSSSPG